MTVPPARPRACRRRPEPGLRASRRLLRSGHALATGAREGLRGPRPDRSTSEDSRAVRMPGEPQIRALVQLIERATSRSPGGRPRLRELAAQLLEWVAVRRKTEEVIAEHESFAAHYEREDPQREAISAQVAHLSWARKRSSPGIRPRGRDTFGRDRWMLQGAPEVFRQAARRSSGSVRLVAIPRCRLASGPQPSRVTRSARRSAGAQPDRAPPAAPGTRPSLSGLARKFVDV